jgi:2-dehydro-3-deoxyphosphooctonate aldolase (KDO 8-P synthase)
MLRGSRFDPDRFFSPTPSPSLLLIAGPCVLEDDAVNLRIASFLAEHCLQLGIDFIFKGSFDKANRSSVRSSRGPGLEEGLARLRRVRETLGVPVLTDIHEASQAAAAAESVDLLQIPAFLCRQTDLLAAAAATGRPVNVKKGQFMAPAEMEQAIAKVRESGGRRILLTERGTFFGYHRLVNDFVGLGDLMELGAAHDCPICFDVTHSTQLPGGTGTASGGRPERAELLARAAVAAGVPAVFIECHPDPAAAPSDASTMQPLAAMPQLLGRLAALRQVAAAWTSGPAER